MQISKINKRIHSLIVLLLLLFITEIFLDNLVKPVYNMYSTYFMHDMDRIKSQGQQVELVFIGGSGEYHTYVPDIFEKRLNMDCVVNAGTSAQPMSATYYQLKNMIKEFHPETVVIGLSWNRLSMTNLQGRLIVYDRLTDLTKLQYVISCFDMKERLYLLYSYRYRENLDRLEEVYNDKQKLIRSNYGIHVNGNEYYADNGFVYSYDSFDNGNISMEWHGKLAFSEEEIVKKENLEYLDACVKLCKDNNIHLYIVTTPISMAMIYSVKNYQGAIDFYKKYAKDNGLIYHDLNFLKNREKIIPDCMMRDDTHLNGKGAHIISDSYAEILQKDLKGIDTSYYFYDDLDEMKYNVNRVVSVDAEITIENGNAHIETRSLQREGVIPFYRIEISENGEDFKVICDWTHDSIFDIELPDIKGILIKVKAKTGNEREFEAEAFQIYNETEIINQ